MPGPRSDTYWPRVRPDPKRGAPVAKSRTTRRRAAALVLVHVIVLVHIAHWQVTGSTLTPLEPSEAMQTLELGYVNAGFVLFLLAIGATLVFGRFFCGWACHFIAYQDLATSLLQKIGWKPRPLRSRLLRWVPFGAAFYMFVWPQVERLLDGRGFPPLVAHFMTDTFWATFPGPGIAALTILVDGFLIVWLLGSKGFCTYGCPYGAAFSVADRLAPGKIRVSDACEHCGHCTSNCSSNVQVHTEVARHGMVVDPGCMKCLDCVSVCPTNALSYAPGRPTWLALLKRPRKRIPYDLTWVEEFLAAAIFFIVLYAFRGLYDLVPFLLALGLAVIAASIGIATIRLARRRNFTFQHHPLRRDGRLGGAGRAYAVTVALLVAFTIHSLAVQVSRREGERLLLRARTMTEAARTPTLESSLAHLLRAERWGARPVVRLHQQIGWIFRAQGNTASAEDHMRRAVAIDEKLVPPRIELADFLIRTGRLAEAEPLLVEALDREPDHDTARRWLAELRRRR